MDPVESKTGLTPVACFGTSSNEGGTWVYFDRSHTVANDHEVDAEHSLWYALT